MFWCMHNLTSLNSIGPGLHKMHRAHPAHAPLLRNRKLYAAQKANRNKIEGTKPKSPPNVFLAGPRYVPKLLLLLQSGLAGGLQDCQLDSKGSLCSRKTKRRKRGRGEATRKWERDGGRRRRRMG